MCLCMGVGGSVGEDVGGGRERKREREGAREREKEREDSERECVFCMDESNHLWVC